MQNLKIDDLLSYRFLSGLEYSPTGERACFIVHQADLEANGYCSNLWIYDTREDRCFQLTAFDQEKGFIWLDDGEHILFAGARDPKIKEKQEAGEDLTVFYQISIRGGEAREAFRLPFVVKSIKQLDDNRFLFTAAHNPARPVLDTLPEEERDRELQRRREEQDYRVLEEIPFWSNGEGFVSLDRNRVYIFHRAVGSWRPLTGAGLQVKYIGLNDSRTRAVLVAHTYEGKMEPANSLYLLDLAADTVKQLTPPGVFIYDDAHFINEDTIVARGKTTGRYGLYENAQFYLVDPASGVQRPLTPGFDRSTGNWINSDCRYGAGEQVRAAGGCLYFITTEGGGACLNRLDGRGRLERLTGAEGTVDTFAVHEGKILFIGQRGLQLQELYRLEGNREHQLTHFNYWVQAERSLALPEPLSVETAPGVAVDGWVIKPAGWREGLRYPAILNIHGGPKTAYGAVFFHEMQYWAGEGFFVFFCNPRGSDGKGNAFADIRGKYGTIDYDDIMAFTGAVLERYPSIDQDRVGVTGGSYGGFMTNWIIGHTGRFRAAASQRSIANWVSMGFTSDIGYYSVTDHLGATPWSDIDKIWAQSPLKYADRVRTPTLFIHSDEDYRCWLAEGLQMFTALKFHGVEARLCLFKGENHELSRSGRPRQRIRRLAEITEWFKRHLLA